MGPRVGNSPPDRGSDQFTAAARAELVELACDTGGKSPLYLSAFEVIRFSPEILCPVNIPLLARFLNRFLVKLWPFSLFALANVIVARPRPEPPKTEEPVVTVVVAARTEEGNVPQIFDRVPEMGGGTELIFVEGNSTDQTYTAIQREIERRPNVRARLFKQPGKGKGDAVREGFPPGNR